MWFTLASSLGGGGGGRLIGIVVGKSLQAKFRARTEEKKESLRKYKTKMCKELRPVAGLMNAYRNELHKFLLYFILFQKVQLTITRN